MSHDVGLAPPLPAAARRDVGVALLLVVAAASAFTAVWVALRVDAGALPGALLADALLTAAPLCALGVVVGGIRDRVLPPSVVIATVAAATVLILSDGPAHLLLLPALAGAFAATLVSPRVAWAVAGPLAVAFVWPGDGSVPLAAWGAAVGVVAVPVLAGRWRLHERLRPTAPGPPPEPVPELAASEVPDPLGSPAVPVPPVARDEPAVPPWASGLSDRQRRVLALVARGLRHAEVAAELGLTPHQVGHDLRRARELSGLPTTRAVVAALPAIAADAGRADVATTTRSYAEPPVRPTPGA